MLQYLISGASTWELCWPTNATSTPTWRRRQSHSFPTTNDSVDGRQRARNASSFKTRRLSLLRSSDTNNRRRTIRTTFATAANGPADGRSRSHRTDLPLQGYQVARSRSASRRETVSTSVPISNGFCKNASTPASRASAPTGIAESTTIGVRVR